VGEEFGPLAHEVHPPAQEIAGGTHASRIDIGHRDHAAAEEDGDLVGVDPVILGFAAVDGFHVQGVAEDEGNPLPRTQVSEPVPGEHALDGHHEILAVRSHELKECLRVGSEVLVDLDVSGLIENTDVEGSGVEIDAAVVEVLLGIESHRGLLLEGW